MWLEAIPESESHSKSCPTCGGCVQRRQYGEMYAGSFIRDGIRVDIRAVPADGYADPISLDPLTQYFDGGLYRLWPKEKYLTRGGKTLHRATWASAFGPIPDDCHIHHRDNNPGNNLLANLECMPASEHLSHSARTRNATVPVGQHFSENARQKAAEWHGSDAGRLWHKRNAERTKGWEKWRRELRNCLACGVEFKALVRKSGNAQIYCTPTCKAASYRERQRGWAADWRERQKATEEGALAYQEKQRAYRAARTERERAARESGRVVLDGSGS